MWLQDRVLTGARCLLVSVHPEIYLSLAVVQFPDLRARVIPVLVRPEGTYSNDSTPLIRELEARHTPRRCTPADPVYRFVDALLEDFADEWLTKPMFAGRFHTMEDATFGAAWQALSSAPIAKLEGSKEFVNQFAARQRGRRNLVGATQWELMEKNIREVCKALEAGLEAGD